MPLLFYDDLAVAAAAVTATTSWRDDAVERSDDSGDDAGWSLPCYQVEQRAFELAAATTGMVQLQPSPECSHPGYSPTRKKVS